MDFLVGKLLTELSDLALDDSTVIAFHGDHPAKDGHKPMQKQFEIVPESHF